MAGKKSHPKFKVPNFGAKKRKGVPERWRKQRGIDNKLRIDKKGYGATPKIGYKNSAEVRFARKEGMFELLVHNEAEMAAMQKDEKHVAVFAHGISRRKRALMQKLADSKGIRVVNRLRK
ncbi:MAG: hypothetical protein KGH57_03010 [Candidatus Micrarchaeota archaeon]|nr:hypothetical protein [Candidatus Micrarchaeota archaeon]